MLTARTTTTAAAAATITALIDVVVGGVVTSAVGSEGHVGIANEPAGVQESDATSGADGDILASTGSDAETGRNLTGSVVGDGYTSSAGVAIVGVCNPVDAAHGNVNVSADETGERGGNGAWNES